MKSLKKYLISTAGAKDRIIEANYFRKGTNGVTFNRIVDDQTADLQIAYFPFRNLLGIMDITCISDETFKEK